MPFPFSFWLEKATTEHLCSHSHPPNVEVWSTKMFYFVFREDTHPNLFFLRMIKRVHFSAKMIRSITWGVTRLHIGKRLKCLATDHSIIVWRVASYLQTLPNLSIPTLIWPSRFLFTDSRTVRESNRGGSWSYKGRKQLEKSLQGRSPSPSPTQWGPTEALKIYRAAFRLDGVLQAYGFTSSHHAGWVSFQRYLWVIPAPVCSPTPTEP